MMKPLVVLLTGFGPLPGAPLNPTAALVHRLARLRHPGAAEVRVVCHVFRTSYRAVDEELPQLLSAYAPDAVLMFGLAAATSCLRVETRARNAISALLRDAEGHFSFATSIAADGPRTLRFTAPTQRLALAARRARVPTVLSGDAGRYLCNYVSWRALEAARKPGGPRVVAFVHVPGPRRARLRRRAERQHRLEMAELVRGGQAILLGLIAEARARRAHMTKR